MNKSVLKPDEVILSDGTTANGDQAAFCFNALHALKQKDPDAFHKLCTRLAARPALDLTEEHKTILIDMDLAERKTDENKRIKLIMPEEEMVRLLRVCIKPPGVIDKLCARFNHSYMPSSYTVISPFPKQADDMKPVNNGFIIS